MHTCSSYSKILVKNDTLSFARDYYIAAEKVSCKYKMHSFIRCISNIISFNTKYIIVTQINFWDSRRNYTAETDSKQNVKNARYYFTRGNSVAHIGNHFIDNCIFLLASVSKELICPEDFTSNKKIEDLLLYKAI